MIMILLGIEVTFRFYHIESLKEKRRIINSIRDHVRARYKISAAEIDYLDNLKLGSMGFGVVSNSYTNSEQVLQKVINHLDTQGEIEIINIEWLEC